MTYSFEKSIENRIFEIIARASLGASKIVYTARESVWWPNMDKDIKDIAFNCDICKAMSNAPPRSDFHSWIKSGKQFYRIHLDHGFWHGYKILVCSDNHSHLITSWLVKDTGIEQTCQRLEEFFLKYACISVCYSIR